MPPAAPVYLLGELAPDARLSEAWLRFPVVLLSHGTGAARDLSVLLDALAVEGPFAGRLDQDRVTAAGFSLGGYTVLSLAGAITDMRLF